MQKSISDKSLHIKQLERIIISLAVKFCHEKICFRCVVAIRSLMVITTTNREEHQRSSRDSCVWPSHEHLTTMHRDELATLVLHDQDVFFKNSNCYSYYYCTEKLKESFSGPEQVKREIPKNLTLSRFWGLLRGRTVNSFFSVSQVDFTIFIWL